MSVWGRGLCTRLKDSLVTELFNVEHAAFRSDVGISQVLDSVDNSSSDCSGDTVVVGLSYTTESGDVGLEQVVLCEVYTSQP
jgi:hypothetical protein